MADFDAAIYVVVDAAHGRAATRTDFNFGGRPARAVNGRGATPSELEY